jgi:hypothetical protein
MPLQRLQFRPGVNRESTTLANEGGWFACDKVRFRSGYPEKIGGWTAFSLNTFLGVCRSLWNWVTLKSFNLVGVGTHLKFYIESGGAYYDITPIRYVSTVAANAFTTAVSTLNGGINANQTSILLASATNFSAAGGVIYIGSEQIFYGTVTGNTLINCVRGFNGTTAAAHSTGATVASSTIIVTDPGHGGQTDDFVTISGATGFVNGIPVSFINGNQEITVIDSTFWTFTIATPAITGGTATNGATFSYEISTGKAVYTAGTGWGAGPWSRLGWGDGFTTGVGQQLRLWSQINYGEFLLFSYRGGPIYIWVPGPGTQPDFATRGDLVTGPECPTQVLQLLISDATRILIAFGCNPYSFDPDPDVLDPLLIRWSVSEDYTDWNPAITNQAGSYRLSHGSLIIGALQTRQENLVWTDTAMYSMQYAGPPFVWNFNILADNISICSPNAMATVNGVVYWMGTDKFYMYAGRVETLPSTLRQFVYSDINRDQFYQVVAGTNEGYNEVWWHYCSANSEINDRYVIYNHLDRVWYYGTMSRTAWLDSPLRGFPMAADATVNRLVFHELGVNDNSTDHSQPINAYIQSSDFDIGDGHNYGFVWRMVPDITFDGSNIVQGATTPRVNFTVLPRRNPGSAYGPADNPSVITENNYADANTYEVQQFTQIVYTRVRGRQMAFKIESNTLGTQWQLGTPSMDVRPDGRR